MHIIFFFFLAPESSAGKWETKGRKTVAVFPGWPKADRLCPHLPCSEAPEHSQTVVQVLLVLRFQTWTEKPTCSWGPRTRSPGAEAGLPWGRPAPPQGGVWGEPARNGPWDGERGWGESHSVFIYSGSMKIWDSLSNLTQNKIFSI